MPDFLPGIHFLKILCVIFLHFLDFREWVVSGPTCSPLDDDDELDAIGLVQGPPPLLVEMGVAEVPTH